MAIQAGNEQETVRIIPHYAPVLSPMPRPNAGVFDSPTACVRINRQWLAYVRGVLEALDQPDAWEGSEAQVEYTRQQVRELAVALGGKDCGMAVEILPADDGCGLKYRNSPEDDWTTVELTQCESTPAPSGGGCLPIGSVFPSMAGTTPANCLPCTGGQYLKADYPDLWAVIVPGSDFDIDADTFAVPDMRGRFALGALGVPGLGYSEIGGETTHTLTINEIPSHTHNFSSGTAVGTGAYPARGNSTLSTPNHVTASAGSGEAHNNMPPYVGLNWYVVAEVCPEGTDGTDGTDGREIELRKYQGWIQWRYVGEGAWINLASFADLRGEPGDDGQDGAQGPPGDPGIPGMTGATGPAGEDGECECGEAPLRDFNPDVEGTKCGVSIAVTAHLRALIYKTYADSDGLIGGLATGANTALAVITFLFPGVAVITAPIALLINAVRAIASLDAQEVNGFDDDAEYDYRCMLLCLLGDNADLSPEIMSAWADLIQEDSRFISSYVAEFVRQAPYDDFQWIAWASSPVDPQACGECEECPEPEEWCYEFDFTTDDHGFVAYPNPGEPDRARYVEGQGWLPSTNSQIRDAIIIVSPAFGEREIMSVKWEFTVAPSGNVNYWYFKGNAGNSTAVVQSGLSALSYTYSLPSGTNLTFFNLGMEEYNTSGTQPLYAGALTRVTVRGKGTNPFGADNCA